MSTALTRRKLVLWLSSACAYLQVAGAAAETRPLRFIVPTPPGSAGDALARALSISWTKSNGQAVVVDDVPGAGSLIGTAQLARAPKDGLTLGVMSSNHTIIPWVFKNLTFDPMADFTPIGMVGSLPMMLVVNNKIAANSPADLSRFANSSATPLSEGLVTGSVYQIASEVFKEQAGFSTNRIFYKGSAQITNDLLAGILDVAFVSAQGAAPFVAAGKLRGLAVTTAMRTEISPQIPTLHETGFPKFNVDAWLAVLAPGGLSPEVTATRRRELEAALSEPDMMKALQAQGIQGRRMTPDELLRFLHEELARNRQVIQRIGIKIE